MSMLVHELHEMQKKQQEIDDYELARSLQVFLISLINFLGCRVPSRHSERCNSINKTG